MASAAEQFAKNLSYGSFAKAKDLQKRILFTIGALIVYRLGTFLPLPGVDTEAFAQFFEAQQNGMLGMFNMLGGGSVERLAIFALNVMPYISASIIMQLMTTVSPRLEALKKEGETGRKQINQYTRYLTVALAALQGYGMAIALEGGSGFVIEPGWFFRFTTVVSLVGGTVFLMWLGEQVTARGIGNGISLIIFAGIVAELPRAIFQGLTFSQTSGGSIGLMALVVAISVGCIIFIVFIERSQRRLLIQYPKRQMGNRMMGGDSSFLPLKLNTAGVIPPIFASALLFMPVTVAGFSAQSSAETGAFMGAMQSVSQFLQPGQVPFMIIYALMIGFFCFFYTSIVFNPDDTAENLRKNGGFILGIRPGKATSEYLNFVLTRLTVIGAAYLILVCLLPEFLKANSDIPLYVGGTSLLIVVTVTLDTVSQIQSHLLAHQYENLIKKSNMRGRRRR